MFTLKVVSLTTFSQSRKEHSGKRGRLTVYSSSLADYTASVALIPIECVGLADHLAASSVSCDTKLNSCLGSGVGAPPLIGRHLSPTYWGPQTLLIPTFVVKFSHGLPDCGCCWVYCCCSHPSFQRCWV